MTLINTPEQQDPLCPICNGAVDGKSTFCPKCALSQYQQRTECERKLWNPKAAGWWSIAFSPLFGAILLDKNWRTLGQFHKAKRTKLLVWITVLFFAFAVLAELFTSSPEAGKAINSLAKICGTGLTAICIAIGRSQNHFLIEYGITDYPKKSWKLPIAIGCVSVATIMALIIFPTQVATDPSLSELESESQRIMQLEFHDRPDLAGATIKKIHINKQNGQNFYGTADISIADKTLHLPLHIRIDGDRLTWQLSNP